MIRLRGSDVQEKWVSLLLPNKPKEKVKKLFEKSQIFKTLFLFKCKNNSGQVGQYYFSPSRSILFKFSS